MDKKRQEKLYKLLGENVKKNRTRLGLTQEKLALALELPRTSLVSVEQGKQQVPLHLLIMLAEIFGVSVETLIPGITDYQPSTQAGEETLKDVKEVDKPKFDEFYRDFFKDEKP